MRVLAIDTALGVTAACVLESGADAPLSAESLAMERGHAEALLPLVKRVMAGAGGGFEALDRIAVTVGPGSFTGLRVGVAAARAIALARSKPVVGVSTLAALAAPLVLDAPGLVVVAIDARHGHVYTQSFGAGASQPLLLSLEEALRRIGAGPARLTGSGAPILAIQAWTRGVEVEVAREGAAAPAIRDVARLGLSADPAASPAWPLYLKAPDVTPPAA